MHSNNRIEFITSNPAIQQGLLFNDMSFYQRATKFGLRFFKQSQMFKVGFNLSPMYRRSQARILHVSEDMLDVKIKLRINWKNRNYMNSIFGGSMFSALDPIPMIQLVYILGNEYVVWDKSANVRFKRPAKSNLFATFTFTENEIAEIKSRVQKENEIEIVNTSALTNKEGDTVYCEVAKQIYIADKAFYKEKRKQKNKS